MGASCCSSWHKIAIMFVNVREGGRWASDPGADPDHHHTAPSHHYPGEDSQVLLSPPQFTAYIIIMIASDNFYLTGSEIQAYFTEAA